MQQIIYNNTEETKITEETKATTKTKEIKETEEAGRDWRECDQ